MNRAFNGEITRSLEKKRAVHPARKPVTGLTRLFAIKPMPPCKKDVHRQSRLHRARQQDRPATRQ